MDELGEFSAIIGEIYDAGLDPELWPEVIRRACDYLGGISGALVSHDLSNRSGQFFRSWNDDPLYTRLYFEKYVKINPALVPLMTVGVGEVVAISTLVPYDEYLASRFHKEWAQPQGYVDSINACLEKTRGSFATFTIARDEAHGVADETAFQRMNLLVPHLRRAVAVGNSLRQHRVQAAQLADTLDGIEASVFILDSGRQVMHANAASKQLTDAGAIVRVNSNQLSALDPAADRLLAEAVAAAEAGDLSIAAKGVSIPLASKGGDHWIAHVLPLTSGQRRRAGAAYSAVAALFIRKASFEISNPVETAARLYKLTEAELRVLFALVASDGIADAANVLGLSQSTVRTHLQSIFRKTNTTRQSALVRLVAALSNPVIS